MSEAHSRRDPREGPPGRNTPGGTLREGSSGRDPPGGTLGANSILRQRILNHKTLFHCGTFFNGLCVIVFTIVGNFGKVFSIVGSSPPSL